MDIPICEDVNVQVFHPPFFGTTIVEKKTRCARYWLMPPTAPAPLYITDWRLPMVNFAEALSEQQDKSWARDFGKAIRMPARLNIALEGGIPKFRLSARPYKPKPKLFLSWFTFISEGDNNWNIESFDPLWSHQVRFDINGIHYWTGIILTDREHIVSILSKPDGMPALPYRRPFKTK